MFENLICLYFSGSNVYKIYYYWPTWDERGDGCYQFMCTCAEHHYKLDVPKITNIAKDPTEVNPIAITDPLYKEILDIAEEAKIAHEKSITYVPNQITQSDRWHPYLQPCCSWSSFCMCSRDTDNALNYKPPWNTMGK